MPKDPSPYLTAHGAQLLAARLRKRGIPYTGNEVLHWPRNTIRAAKLWLGLGTVRWHEFMAEDLPAPPLHPAWGAAAQHIQPEAPARVSIPPQSPPTV